MTIFAANIGLHVQVVHVDTAGIGFHILVHDMAGGAELRIGS